MPTWVQLVYLGCAVCFILALKGLTGPRTARTGNLIGAAAAVVACAVPFFYLELDHLPLILGAIAVGTGVGVLGAHKVQMTQMPQMVALCNGAGGAAVALVALLALDTFIGQGNVGWFVLVATAVATTGGALSFAGSAIAFAKLQDLIPSRPVAFPGSPVLLALALLAAVGSSATLATTDNPQLWIGITLAGLGLLLGVLLVLPIGGADVAIILSLLNALTGLAVAAGGYLLGITVLLVAGTLVAAAGTLLTLLMARASGRPVNTIVLGALRGGTPRGVSESCDRPARSARPEDAAIALNDAERVIVVPGYGLALAQAQHQVRALVDILNERGIATRYAIHPVAGRMPGHMNVLLAQAQVPYEQLIAMDDINEEFADTDVVLVVGANDVVNPAARTDPDAPIYQMSILNADHAGRIIFVKRSLRPGFAGIENELLFDHKTMLIFGDVKESMNKLVKAVAAL